jgi:hypothetical protein
MPFNAVFASGLSQQCMLHALKATHTCHNASKKPLTPCPRRSTSVMRTRNNVRCSAMCATCLFTFCACFVASSPDFRFSHCCVSTRKLKAHALLGIFGSLLTLITYGRELLFTELISNISPTDTTVPPGFGDPRPRGLRREPSSPARALVSWVRIPLEAWMSVCICSVWK